MKILNKLAECKQWIIRIVKRCFTACLMIEVNTISGLFGWYRKYKSMGENIRKEYGEITYENYIKYIRSLNNA